MYVRVRRYKVKEQEKKGRCIYCYLSTVLSAISFLFSAHVSIDRVKEIQRDGE